MKKGARGRPSRGRRRAAAQMCIRDRVKHEHFRINRIVPWLGAAACLFLVTPLTGRDVIQYQVAGWLLLLGVVMWGVTYLARSREDKMRLDPSALE